MSRDIEIIPLFETNYAYLIWDSGSRNCACIDPGEADTVAKAVKARAGTLTHILSTHHHGDHTGGNLALKAAFGAKIVGSAFDDRIPGRDIGVGEGDVLGLPVGMVRVLATPGHTRGSVCYALADALFTGDTLFAMGCGRLFEGDGATMMKSLAEIAAFAEETRLYPGHEYALNNARFARTLEPDNALIRTRLAHAEAKQQRVPFTLAEELRSNPFLRLEIPTIRKTLKMMSASPEAVFSEIRRRKDVF